MFKYACYVEIKNEDVQKYTKRAEELGYRRYPSLKNNSVFYIKLYPDGYYNLFSEDSTIINGNTELSQKEFFGEKVNGKMNPQDVLEVVKSFGYTHVCQTGNVAMAIAGEVCQNPKNGYYVANKYKELDIKINWPDPENMIYPALLKNYVDVRLNEANTARVFKDRIEIDFEVFPISVINALDSAFKSL